MSIKKVYVELVELLESNSNKKVSAIMDEIRALCESKTQTSASIYIDDKLIAIFCYYHKQWELVDEVEYGSKKSSATGLNTMCKVGVSQWTKQQRIAKQETANILTLLMEERIKPTDIEGMKEDIEARRLIMDKTDMPIGFANAETALAHFNTAN
jgi:hypothetical protein